MNPNFRLRGLVAKGRHRRRLAANASLAEMDGALGASSVVSVCCWAGRSENFRFECLGVERLGEEEALDLVDVVASEMIQLARGFNAFGEGCEAEVLTELDERPDERPGLW